MNKFLTLFFLGITLNLSAQSDFEGRISFNIQYFDSLGNRIEPATIGRDSEMHYYISGGNYKSFNEKGIITQLFNGSTNKYYFNNQGQVQVLDASVKFPQTGVVEHLDGELSVLGNRCKKLSIRSERDLTVYYYVEDLTVNKQLFQNHNFGHWNLFLNSTNGALALKYEIAYPGTGLSMVMEAYEMEKIDLSEGDFDIGLYLER